MLYRAALAFALLLPATTLPAAESQEERMACTPDAQNLCADEIPDREKVYSCLVKKVNDLSPACKKIISASIGPVSKGKK
jgi:Cysteine rich repeat